MREVIIKVSDKEFATYFEQDPNTKELIQCKDCKHLSKFKVQNKLWCLKDEGLACCVQFDSYCSYGERKDGDAE